MFAYIKYFSLFLIICGITIVRDRELAENELEYYKQMNYGLWTILIPFLQFILIFRFLLLPIFPKKQKLTILSVEEVLNSVPITDIQNQNTTDISNLHQLETENQEQLKNLDKKEENIQQNSQIKSNRISILNCSEQTDPQQCSRDNLDQQRNQSNQQIDTSHDNKIILLNLNTSENELNANNISDISHQNQRSFTEETERESSNLIQNSKIIHSYSNSYQVRDQSVDQIDENSFSLIRILEIIDEVPLLVMRKYEEFVRINREQRRKFIYKEHNEFTEDDAQQYIKLLKNLFKFHDNLIRKGQKYYIYKNKQDYSKFMKCFKQYLLDPLSSNEILSHQRFALKQIRYSLQNNHTLLNYQVLEVYQILIQLMSNPNEILVKISQQFNQQQEQLYLSSILQYYLEDFIYQQKGIEDEDFQRYLNIYHNQNEIINMQYTLDEKTNQFLYKLQRN